MASERLSEFDLIAWIRRTTPPDPRVPLGPGDDCALVRLDGRDVLITTDQVVEGVHFEAGATAPALVGRKAFLRAVSDIAAMAGTPRAAVASFLLQPGLSRDEVEALYAGMLEAAAQCATALVGGDIAAGGERLVISVTVIGEPHPRGPVRRDGARPGDAIFATGCFGGSLLGRHLAIAPRLREARELADAVALHAMIDVSDGLSQDLHHILRESGVGAVLFADAVPICGDARRMAERTGRTPLEHALSDGEDHELVFTVGPEDAGRVPSRLATGAPVTRIGEVIAGEGLFLEVAGERRPLPPCGWVHRA